MQIDIIIPVFRDNEALGRFLSLPRYDWGRHDLRVVFGGPDAEGEALAANRSVPWQRADSCGRARQMNAGAACGSGDILLFLHADTVLPAEALSMIRKAVESGASGGAFARRFDSSSPWLRISCRLADWRGRALRVFLGDQAIFVRRDVFEDMGGFDESAAYEDLDFSLRLRRKGRTALLRPPILSSARRFTAKGVVRQSIDDFLAGSAYLLRHRRAKVAKGDTPSKRPTST